MSGGRDLADAADFHSVSHMQTHMQNIGKTPKRAGTRHTRTPCRAAV